MKKNDMRGWFYPPSPKPPFFGFRFYLAPKSPNGGSSALAPASRHCSKFSLIALVMFDASASFALKTLLFLAFHSSQVVAMIMVRTPFLSSFLV